MTYQVQFLRRVRLDGFLEIAMKSLKRRIVSNPKILVGKPTVAGTRISVELILNLLSSGWTYEEIIKNYQIKKEDILAALDFAGQTLKDIQSVSLGSDK